MTITSGTIITVQNPEPGRTDQFVIDSSYDQTSPLYIAYETGAEDEGNSTTVVQQNADGTFVKID